MSTTLYGYWVKNQGDATQGETFFVPPQAGIAFGHHLIEDHGNQIPTPFYGFEVKEFKTRNCWFYKEPDSSAHYGVSLLREDYDDHMEGEHPLSDSGQNLHTMSLKI